MLSPVGDLLKSKIFIQVTLEMVRWTQVNKMLSGNKVIIFYRDFSQKPYLVFLIKRLVLDHNIGYGGKHEKKITSVYPISQKVI